MPKIEASQRKSITSEQSVTLQEPRLAGAGPARVHERPVGDTRGKTAARVCEGDYSTRARLASVYRGYNRPEQSRVCRHIPGESGADSSSSSKSSSSTSSYARFEVRLARVVVELLRDNTSDCSVEAGFTGDRSGSSQLSSSSSSSVAVA